MKSDDTTYYLIHKTSDERHGGLDGFYGWTTNKSILNAFLKQRGKGKYIAEKIILSEEAAYSKRGLVDMRYLDLTDDLMVDILSVKSNQTGEVVKLFTNKEEQIRIVNDIDKVFDDLRSFQNIDDSKIKAMVDMYRMIGEKYVDALETIGYRPLEIDYMYDSIDEIYHEVNYGLDYIPDEDDILHDAYAYNMSKNVIYSLEAVIKVLKDELL